VLKQIGGYEDYGGEDACDQGHQLENPLTNSKLGVRFKENSHFTPVIMIMLTRLLENNCKRLGNVAAFFGVLFPSLCPSPGTEWHHAGGFPSTFVRRYLFLIGTRWSFCDIRT
jgi:hypothetical protein